MSENRSPLRIGNDERNAAIKALDEHLSAGRLDHEEYGERMASASMARTREQLEELFVDLPQPRPFTSAPPPVWGTRSWAPPAWNQYTQPPPRAPRPALPVAAIVAILVVLAPVIITLLAVFGGLWFLFFLIPAFSAVFGGRRRGPRGVGGPFGWGCHSYRR